MKPLEFSYWLKGGFEFSRSATFDVQQVKNIALSLSLVEFDKKDRMNEFCLWLQDYMKKNPDFHELQIISIKQHFYDELCKINEVGEPVKFDMSVYPPELLDRC